MSDIEDVHPIFINDPEDWMKFVYKKVQLLTKDGQIHEGLVYTIDPVSESVVLANFDESKTSLEIVLGHAVSSAVTISEDVDEYKERLDSLCHTRQQRELSVEEVKQQQTRVRLWLLKNRLPITTSGPNGEFLNFADALVIKPPYGPEDCVSTNEIILGKIQGLIKNMPNDQQDW